MTTTKTQKQQQQKVLDIGVFDAPKDELNPSPFCNKLELFLKVANVPYGKPALKPGDMGPRGKLPYATFAKTGAVVADSANIIDKLETMGFGLDDALTDEEKLQSRLVMSLCEDRLYFVTVYFAWQDPENWPTTRAEYFAAVPCVLRGFISKSARKGVVGALKGQGTGRRPVEEIVAIGTKIVDDLSTLLGDKKTFFDTPKPTTADVAVFAQLDKLLYTAVPNNPVGDHLRTHAPNLVAFVDNVAATYFPEVAKKRTAGPRDARE